MNLYIVKVGGQYHSLFEDTANRLLAKPYPMKTIAEAVAKKLTSNTSPATVEEYWPIELEPVNQLPASV